MDTLKMIIVCCFFVLWLWLPDKKADLPIYEKALLPVNVRPPEEQQMCKSWVWYWKADPVKERRVFESFDVAEVNHNRHLKEVFEKTYPCHSRKES